MNANEVIAALAGEDVHPNDDVNMGQSSNDVFPSAVHLAALDELTNDLLPALELLAASLEAKAAEFDDVVKSGRTHLMDAVPVTLGQEFGGYAAQVRQGSRASRTRCRASARSRSAAPPPARASTRTRSSPRACARSLGAETGLDDLGARRPVRGAGRARRARRGVRRAQDRRGLADEDRERPPAHGLGPAGRARGDLPARAAEGQLDHARKVNPVIPEVVTQVAAQVIGNDSAIAIGGMQGHFELNVFVPLLARNLLDSIKLLLSASRLLAEKCVDGIEANRETVRALRRADALGGDRAQPVHRIRRGDRDRQGGGVVRPVAARGRAGARRRGARSSTRRSTTARWRSRTNR